MIFSRDLATRVLCDYVIEHKSIDEISEFLKCDKLDVTRLIKTYTPRLSKKHDINYRDIQGYMIANYGNNLTETLNSYMHRKNNTLAYKIIGIPLEILFIILLVILLIPIAIISQ